MSKSDPAKSAMTIFYNAIAPFYGTDRIIGTTMNVAAEVVVEGIVRKMIGVKGVPWFDMVAYHTLSQPFIGAFAAAGDLQDIGTGTSIDQAMDGARGIPAVLLGKYILYTYYGGFFIPGFNMKELLVTAAAKTITRPLVHLASGWMPKTLTDQLAVVDAIYKSQMANSKAKFD